MTLEPGPKCRESKASECPGAPLLQAGGAAGASAGGTACLTCSNGRPGSMEDGKQRGG